MKKILLVENVIPRYVKARSELLPDFEDIIVISETVPRRKKDSIYTLEEYEAILLHKNYFENDERLIDQVIMQIKEKKIPFILFSGESPSSKSDLISHNDFYRNLPYFLEYYRYKLVIEFNILIYGKHFVLNDILSLKEKIIIEFINKKYSESLSLSRDQKINIEKILRKMNYNEELIIKSLQNLSDISKYKTIEEFIKRLNSLIERFTKGINETTSL